MPRIDHEDVRQGYRPEEIRVLFIGESRPTSGRFFYWPEDIAVGLRYHTMRAFNQVLGHDMGDGESFLRFFQGKGCYLDDLSRKPINGLERPARRLARRAGERSLARRIREYEPRAFITTPLAIRNNVRRAIGVSGSSAPAFWLPFPVRGHQQRYVRELVPIMKQLIRDGILSRG